MDKTEQLKCLLNAYIEVCQGVPFDDSQIIDALMDIIEPEELVELGYSDFIKEYMANE